MKQFYIHAMTDDCEEWNEKTTDFIVAAEDVRGAARIARAKLDKGNHFTRRMIIDEVKEIKND